MGKLVLLTGGGTAGHVTPNIALLPGLRARGLDIRYIGSETGIEKMLMEKEGIPYDGIPTGKFRRNLKDAGKNLHDLKNIRLGIEKAHALIKKYQPDVVFSKGGYVAVPVVLAAAREKIPVIIHESDMTPGMANRLCVPRADIICCNFPETLEHLNTKKAVLTGTPIRAELLSGSREAGLNFTGFSGEKPILLMVGGSLGARALNNILRRNLEQVTKTFDVIHLCGKGNLDPSLVSFPGYVQYEYIQDELKDLFACTDIVFSRAGANAICELLALKKPALLVPLPKVSSRGDQILNAHSFEKQGFSMVIEQEELTDENFVAGLLKLYQERDSYIQAMANAHSQNGTKMILDLIDRELEK